MVKIKRIGAICRSSGRVYLTDQRDAAGDIVMQWLGDGIAAYPMAGLPVMDLDNVCTMFDFTAKQRDGMILNHIDATDAINLEDADAGEIQIPEPELCLRWNGKLLLPLETSDGIALVDEKYLAPLGEADYLGLYERRSRDGKAYVAAKIGLIVWAIILPLKLPDAEFTAALENLTRRCQAALAMREARETE